MESTARTVAEGFGLVDAGEDIDASLPMCGSCSVAEGSGLVDAGEFTDASLPMWGTFKDLVEELTMVDGFVRVGSNLLGVMPSGSMPFPRKP